MQILCPYSNAHVRDFLMLKTEFGNTLPKNKLAVLMHQTNGSFTYCHKITGLLKNIVLSLIYVN